MNTKILGDAGEIVAERYLYEHGCKVIETKFRCFCGEVDLIVRDKKTLVFVEVKARKSNYFGTPGQAVTLHKQRKIIQTAQCYMAMHHIDEELCRFDVLEVYYKGDSGYKVNWLKNAFESE